MVGGLRPNTEHTTALLDLAGESGLVHLMYPPDPSFGTLFIFRMKGEAREPSCQAGSREYGELELHQFASLLEASVLEETGISYRLSDHIYSEESSQW